MYWPLLNMYSENFGFGPGGFFIRGTFINGGRDYLACLSEGGWLGALSNSFGIYLLCQGV